MCREVSSTIPRAADRLAGEARARAARDHGHVEAPGDGDRRRDVVGVAREGDDERLARVHARVAREEVARVGVGAHVAAQLAPQRGGELRRRASPPVPAVASSRT